MSGGYFAYSDSYLGFVADDIEFLIGDKDENGCPVEFSAETVDEFKKAVALLRRARVYARRIDWLASGDDGEETFHRRLKQDLAELPSSELQIAAEAALRSLEGPASLSRARSPAESRQWSDERARVIKQLRAALGK